MALTSTNYYKKFISHCRRKIKARHHPLTTSIFILHYCSEMGSNVLPGRRYGVIIGLIHLFGLSYFTFVLSYFLLRHFPKNPEVSGTAQGVVFYSGGVILWCLSSLAYRALWFFRGEQAAPWQWLELAGALTLIYISAIPFVILHFSGHFRFRVIYLSCLTMVAAKKMAQVLTTDQINLDRDRVFRYHCVLMGLLALAPAVHGLCQMSNSSLFCSPKES